MRRTITHTLAVMLSVLLIASTVSATKISARSNRRKVTSNLDGIKSSAGKRKLLLKKKKSNPHARHSFNSPNMCLNYSCDELVSMWKFPGDMPDCPGLNCNGSSSSSSSSGSSSSSSSGSSSSSSSGSSSSSSGSGGGSGGGGYYGGNGGNGGGNGGNGNDDENNGGNQSNNNNNYGDDDGETFQLNDCSSYSDYWMWDLNLSCQNSTNYEGCECTTAAMMLESGNLQCPDGTNDNPYCPAGCSICETCLTLLGCAETRPENPFRPLFNLNLIWYALAALLGIVLGIIAMSVHKKGANAKPLQESLVAGSASPAGDDNVWLAPVEPVAA